MTDIKSMTIDELKKLMTTLGDKPFRAKQMYRHPGLTVHRSICSVSVMEM